MMDEARDSISEAIYKEASQRFVRHERSLADQPDDNLVAWLDSDPRHAAAYADIANAWEQSEVLAQSDLSRGRKLMRAPFYMRRNMQLAVVAAMAILVIGLVSVQGLGSPSPLDVGSPVRAETYRTSLGEIRTWRLLDGTVLTLDTQSEVDVAVQQRAIRIQVRRGRARIDGRQSTTNAPIVLVGGASVDAGGGVLDMSLLGSKPSYAVIQGKVRVRRDEKTSHGNEDAAEPDGSTELRETDDKLWPQGLIDLDHMPLGHAARMLNRYNAIQIRIEGQNLALKTLSGGFRLREPEAFANAAASALDLDIQKQASEIVLSSRSN